MPRRKKDRRWKTRPEISSAEMEMVFKILKDLIWELPPPWRQRVHRDERGRRLGGRPRYPARPLALVCIMLVYYNLTLRDVESIFESNKDWLWEMEVRSAPDKNTISNSLCKSIHNIIWVNHPTAYTSYNVNIRRILYASRTCSVGSSIRTPVTTKRYNFRFKVIMHLLLPP